MASCEASDGGELRDDRQQLTRLLDRMRVINRISSALARGLTLDDIHLIMLSALVSKRGLDFSRGILLTRNERTMRLEGRLALGPLTREEAEAFDREILAEEEAIESMSLPPSRLVEQVPSGPARPDAARAGREGPPIPRQTLDDLKANAQWISTFQWKGGRQALYERVRDFVWAYPQADDDRDNPLRRAAVLDEVIESDRPQDRLRLPPPLDEIVDEAFVVIPLTTKKGLRALVLADRKFAPRPIGEADLHLLEWFRNQSVLAIENAELFDHLADAYNEIQEFDHLKSDFLSKLSHELHTPLTAILGFTELLLNGRAGRPSASQRDLLRRVLDHGGRLQDMFSDLLELAETETGGLIDLEIEPVDPLTAFMNTLQKIEPRRARKNVAIEPCNLEAAPAAIPTNQRALERILFHLLDNAVKFIPESGRVEVEFKTEADRFMISVKDNGIGISPGNMRKIFDNFYQVDSRLTRRYSGLGIGLTVTKKLVDALRGEIRVESALEKGTTFYLSFPIHQPGAQAPEGKETG